jgi:ribokinase
VTQGGTRVIVVGDALLDVTARPMGAVRIGADVPAHVRIGPGGQGANLAVRLARLGSARVQLVCALGGDPAGALLTSALRDEGVELRPVSVESTGTVVITVGDDGERTMMSQRAGFAAAAADAVGDFDAEWVVLSGYLFTEDDAGSLARAVASKPTRRVVVGCAVPAAAVPPWRQAVREACPDLVILNREEASAVAPADALADGIVVTRRERVTASIGEVAVEVSLDGAAPAIDTTGAGDAFAAGLAYALARRWDPPRAGRFANAVGALSTRALGAQAALPTLAEVAAVLGADEASLRR